MTIYRRRISSDVWHWRRDCTLWPRWLYRSRRKKPTTGELCDECRAKAKSEVIR